MIVIIDNKDFLLKSIVGAKKYFGSFPNVINLRNTDVSSPLNGGEI
jgi:hypothetical protein